MGNVNGVWGLVGPSIGVWRHGAPVGMEATWVRLNMDSMLWGGLISDYRYVLGADDETHTVGLGVEAGLGYLGTDIMVTRQMRATDSDNGIRGRVCLVAMFFSLCGGMTSHTRNTSLGVDFAAKIPFYHQR